jgi:hypothetical protein
MLARDMKKGSSIGPIVLGVSLLLLASGCTAAIGDRYPVDEMPGSSDDPAGTEPRAKMQIVSPAQGTDYKRDFVGRYGQLAALVDLQVNITGPIASVGFELADGRPLGMAGEDLLLLAELDVDGPVAIMARAYDDSGQVMATDTVEFTVSAPQSGDCYEWLDLYGIEYTRGPNNPGVSAPVTLSTPINGVSYRYTSSASPRQTFFMDCSLALSLARGAAHLRRHDIIEVADIGVYNYRCINRVGTPPDCPYGVSQHAYARGIDIAGFTTGDGTYFSVNDDWIINGGGEQTCSAATEPGKDRFLHEIICAMKADRVWNIVLTPNYNADHRNHFHVDLTDGSDFLKSNHVDVGPDLH